MGLAELPHPSFHSRDFGLKSIKRRCLPVRSPVAKWQRVRLGIDSDERQQVRVPFTYSGRKPGRNDFSRAFDIGKPPCQHVLCGFKDRATSRQNLGFIPAHGSCPSTASVGGVFGSSGIQIYPTERLPDPPWSGDIMFAGRVSETAAPGLGMRPASCCSLPGGGGAF
jgi:hypothetical protein